MTERQIEAAAKAIYREAGWDRKWRDITESGRERFRKAARAALRAANRTHGERAQDTKEG